MPVMRGSVSVAANTDSGNVLDGEDFEFLSSPAFLQLLAGMSAAGLLVALKINSEDLVDDAVPNVVAAAGRLIEPDDQVLDRTLIAPGRLKLVFTNTTAGSLTAYWSLEVDIQGAQAAFGR